MDHETSGAQEWQLPGYGRARPKNKTTPITTQPEVSVPRNITKPEPQKQIPATAPVKHSSVVKYPLAVRGSSRARGRGASRGYRESSRGGISAHSIHLFRDSPAKADWRNGLDHTGMVKLPAAFGSFKHEFAGAARAATIGRKPMGVQNRNEVFENISQKTGAYVKPPAYSDQVIHLWGEPTQVAAAAEILQSLIAKCNTPMTKKKPGWTKIKSYSVNKEADAELKEKHEIMVQQLRVPPDPNIFFPEKLLFLWPKDGPSLSDSLGPHLEALDVIRARFGCHVFVPKNSPDRICALGHSYDTMIQITHRLRTLWGEVIAKSNVKSKVYIIDPPEPSTMKTKIVVKKYSHLHKPTLRGNRLKGTDLENWQSQAHLIQSKNNTRLLKAVTNSLRCVSFVRGHLRMRVNLGSFVLENYQTPDGDKSWYSFEEFREMLLHEQTKGRLIPGLKVEQPELLERCFKASNLLEPYDCRSASLETPELAYSVNFEFLGADKSMLRLEAEFAKSPGAQDYEITQRRWLRPRSGGQSRDKRPPLHVAVIDFGRSDWQLEIKSLEFYEASSIDTALKSFSHSIGFRRTANVGDISAKPERKVTFPASAPVSRFVEKSAIRYRLKGTKYIFEIARYDEYSRANVPAFPGQSPATMTGQILDVPCTCWGASVFDPNWDNLLGGHANLSVGHSAKYSPNLGTFFPSKEPSSNQDDESKGFWEFVDLVKQTGELLGPTKKPSSENCQESYKKDMTCAGLALLQSDSLKIEVPAPGNSSTNSPTDRVGLLNADLGTLF